MPDDCDDPALVSPPPWRPSAVTALFALLWLGCMALQAAFVHLP